jgi:ribosomal protein S18 acetylase RimI-like enzyme
LLRPLREEDAEAVVGLYREAFGAERPIDAAEVVAWCRNSELDAELLRVLEVDGRIAGYGDLVVSGDALAVDVAAPGHWDVFLDWAEETARAKGMPRVRVFLPSGHELAEILAQRGYRHWLSAFTMEVDLADTGPGDVAPPPEFVLRSYEDADSGALRYALDDAFAGDPLFEETTESRFREFYVGARGFDPSLWLLAWDSDELAGFALAFPERFGDETLGWIDSLGVRPRYRSRGLGTALLHAVLGRLHARGLRRVGLGVEAENEAGLRLYERAGMRVVREAENWVLDA